MCLCLTSTVAGYGPGGQGLGGGGLVPRGVGPGGLGIGGLPTGVNPKKKKPNNFLTHITHITPLQRQLPALMFRIDISVFVRLASMAS